MSRPNSDVSTESQGSGHRVSFMPEKYGDSQNGSFTASPYQSEPSYQQSPTYQETPSYTQTQSSSQAQPYPQTQAPFTQLAPPAQHYSYPSVHTQQSVATIEDGPARTSSTVDVHQKGRNAVPKETVPWYAIPLGILATLLCCLVGPFSLVYACRAKSAKDQGQTGKAEGFASISFCFAILAIFLGTGLITAVIVLAVLDDEYLSMFAL